MKEQIEYDQGQMKGQMKHQTEQCGHGVYGVNVYPPSSPMQSGQSGSGQLVKRAEKHVEIQEAISFLEQSIDRLEGLYEMITGEGKPGAQGCPNSVLCLASTLDQSPSQIRQQGERIYRLADALREVLF